MSEFRAIVLDLDGTVVKPIPEAEPSDEVVAAVKEARENDAIVTIATGRPFWMAKHIINRLGVVDYCVVNGGPEIQHPLVEEPSIIDPLDPESQAETIAICHSLGLPVYDGKNQYAGWPIDQHNQPAPNNSKLFVEAIDRGQAQALEDILHRMVPEVAPHSSTSWRAGEVVDVHITSAHATKADGVATLIDMLDISPRQVIGVGDSYNDLPMFKSVGLSVAMGNAPRNVQERANIIAPPLEEDGVAWVIRNFILNDAGVRLEQVAVL